jgi:phosphoglycerate dehydrogenase-like enzyme
METPSAQSLAIYQRQAEEYKRALQQKFPEVAIHAASSEEELEELAEEMTILLAFTLPDELLRRASRLKWIQSLATGVDLITNLPSLRKDIIITSMRGIHGPQMSEMAFLLMLALGRKFPAMVHNQDRAVWEQWPGKLLWRNAVGILGLGVIGEEIARKCKAFGMTVYGIDIVRKEIASVDHYVGPEDLEKAAAEVDFLIVVAPNTPQTTKIVSESVLSAMKPSAFLINISRGELVDDVALIRALERKTIAGAALDTFVGEPLPPDHPYWKMENVVVTPHIGGWSDIYIEQVLPIIEENLSRFLAGNGDDLINLVTP